MLLCNHPAKWQHHYPQSPSRWIKLSPEQLIKNEPVESEDYSQQWPPAEPFCSRRADVGALGSLRPLYFYDAVLSIHRLIAQVSFRARFLASPPAFKAALITSVSAFVPRLIKYTSCSPVWDLPEGWGDGGRSDTGCFCCCCSVLVYFAPFKGGWRWWILWNQRGLNQDL